MISNNIDNQVIVIPNVLSATECSELISLTENIGYQVALVNTDAGKVLNTKYRNNSKVEFNNKQLSQTLWYRMQRQIPKKVDGKSSVGISDKFKCYRYVPGQQFDWHQDGSIARNMHEKSIYTCMIYLNEGYQGGTTDICCPIPFKPQHVEIVYPRAGMGLLFRHELRHRGSPVLSGTKYALRTDVLYKKEWD